MASAGTFWKLNETMGTTANNLLSTNFSGGLGSNGPGTAEGARPVWTPRCICNIPSSGNAVVRKDCSLYSQVDVSGSLNVTGIPGTDGALPKIVGGGSNRLFVVFGSGSLIIRGLNLTGGDVSTNGGTNDVGGAVYVKLGRFYLYDSVVYGNKAKLGGGIRSEGDSEVYIYSSHIMYNYATESHGGVLSLIHI